MDEGRLDMTMIYDTVMERSVYEEGIDDELDEAIDNALRRISGEVAHNRDMSTEVAESRFVGFVERLMGCEFDEDSRGYLRSVMLSETCDSRWLDPKSRRMLGEEVYQSVRGLIGTPRWEEVVDLMRRRGFFTDVSVSMTLLWRTDRPFSSGGLRSHGVTAGWQTGLSNGWSRVGFDPIWNKVRDAAILLYWPEAEGMGDRKWDQLMGVLSAVLDPRSEEHREFLRDPGRYSVDMDPRYGSW